MKKTLLLIVFVLTNITAFTQNPAAVDLSFPNNIPCFDGDISITKTQPDGKILVGGGFSNFYGASQNRLIRLNPNGIKDDSFNIGSGFSGPSNTLAIQTVSIQQDGKIIVGGQFGSYNGNPQNCLIRLNVDGSKDIGFNIGSGFNDMVTTTSIQADGKIIVAGWFTSYDGTAKNRIVRLHPDGTLDSSFNIGSGFNGFVKTTSIQSDGKIIVGGQFSSFNNISQNYFVRLNIDGSFDNSLVIGSGFNEQVTTTLLQPDGKILVGGYFTSYNGNYSCGLIRLNSNGTKDTNFNTGSGPLYEQFSLPVSCLTLQTDGKIIVGGNFTMFLNQSQFKIIRINTNGSKDFSFNIGSGFNADVYTTSVQFDGKILVGGRFTTYNGVVQNKIALLNIDGTNSGSYTESGFNENIYSILLQNDNKILLGGFFSAFNGNYENKITRLSENGFIDNSFNIGTGFNERVYCMALQSDGKILIGGYFTTFQGITQNYIARLNSDGSLDNSFNIGSGFNGIVKSIELLSNGKILVGGQFTSFNGSSQNRLIRLNYDGSKDETFNIGSGFNMNVNIISLEFNGKLMIGGDFTSFNGSTQNRLIRLNDDGSKDNTFDISLGFNLSVYSITLLQNECYLIGGGFTSYNGIPQNYLIKLNSNGLKDNTFNIGNGFNNTVLKTVKTPNNKILVGGFFTTFNSINQNRIIQLNLDGSKDNNFNIGLGFNNSIYSLAVQPDNKILVGGIFTTYNGVNSKNLIRLKGETLLSTNEFSKNEISLYPNPVKDILNISLSENTSIESYEVYDLLGKKIISKNTTENNINVSELSNGVYILKVATSDGIINNKFIKE